MGPICCPGGCLRGHGANCYARRVGVARYGELIAAGREDYGRLIDQLTAGCEEMPFPGHPVSFVQVPETTPMALTMARLARVKSCPHRGEKVPCGCAEDRHFCALGRGSDGQPFLRECMDCVAGWPG